VCKGGGGGEGFVSLSGVTGADPRGIECSSRYGQIFSIMDSKIVLGKNSPLIYFYAIHFCFTKNREI
jgi:hypothetical protein